ncbi:MAG: hypothetical protein DRP64_14895 [Verrucomicrobia bacterium]|nr:MAG: hypothetical protein DRP64_14895 [Verrucomicrobiota bacterium]
MIEMCRMCGDVPASSTVRGCEAYCSRCGWEYRKRREDWPYMKLNRQWARAGPGRCRNDRPTLAWRSPLKGCRAEKPTPSAGAPRGHDAIDGVVYFARAKSDQLFIDADYREVAHP